LKQGQLEVVGRGRPHLRTTGGPTIKFHDMRRSGTIAGLVPLEWSGAHRRRGPPDLNGPSLPPALGPFLYWSFGTPQESIQGSGLKTP
jgi:hypothetical protein